jgi:Resolvase, N terminal domain
LPLVVAKLDRLAHSVPDACSIGDSLVARDVRLSLGGTIYDPLDPMGKMFFNILATLAEFEVALLRMRTREGMAAARDGGKLHQEAQAHRQAATRTGPHARHSAPTPSPTSPRCPPSPVNGDPTCRRRNRPSRGQFR